MSFNTPLGHPDRFQPGPPDLHPDAPALARRTVQWTHSRFVRARTVYLSKSAGAYAPAKTSDYNSDLGAVNTESPLVFTFFRTPRREPRARSLEWRSTHTPINSIPCAPAASSTIFYFPPQHPAPGLIGPPAAPLEPIPPPPRPAAPSIYLAPREYTGGAVASR